MDESEELYKLADEDIKETGLVAKLSYVLTFC